MAAVLIFPERRRAALLDERDGILAEYDAECVGKERKTSASRLSGLSSAFAKFQKIAGLASWGDTDMRIINLASADWEIAYQFHTRQAGGIPVSVMGRWAWLIGDKNIDIPERLSARSFIIAVAAGIRRNDLLNTAPSTLDLMNEGRIGFAERPKRGRSLKGDIGGLEWFLTLQMVRTG